MKCRIAILGLLLLPLFGCGQKVPPELEGVWEREPEGNPVEPVFTPESVGTRKPDDYKAGMRFAFVPGGILKAVELENIWPVRVSRDELAPFGTWKLIDQETLEVHFLSEDSGAAKQAQSTFLPGSRPTRKETINIQVKDAHGVFLPGSSEGSFYYKFKRRKQALILYQNENVYTTYRQVSTEENSTSRQVSTDASSTPWYFSPYLYLPLLALMAGIGIKWVHGRSASRRGSRADAVLGKPNPCEIAGDGGRASEREIVTPGVKRPAGGFPWRWVIGGLGGVLLVGLGLAVVMALKSSPSGSGRDADSWAEYMSRDGRYRVCLPGTPKFISEPLWPGAQVLVHQATVVVDEGKQTFSIAYFDISDRAVSQGLMFELDRDFMRRKHEGKLLSEKKLTMGAYYPGLESDLLFTSPRSEFVRVRYFRVRNRVFRLAVTVEASTNDGRIGPEAEKFFDSFSAVDANPASSPAR